MTALFLPRALEDSEAPSGERIDMAEWSAHMEAVREELSRLRSEISGLRSELRQDLSDHSSEFRRELERLILSDREQAIKIAKLEVQSSLWGGLGGLIAASVAIAIAIVTRVLG